jgi:apolipoprotein N-acyltransferase
VASLLLGLLVAWRVRRFRKLAVVRLGICLVALVMAGWGLTGCGGGSGPSTPTSPGTPAGTSTITVTATSGTLSHTTIVTLVVQ